MRSEFLPGQRAVDVEAHIARLHCLVLLCFGDANHVEVLSFRVVQRGILEIRIGLVPASRLKEAVDVGVLEDAAVLTENNSADKF